MTHIEVVEQKIKQGEALLAQEKTKIWTGWLPFLIVLPVMCRMAAKISQSPIYWVFAGLLLLYMGFSIWRSYDASRNVKQLESRIQQYRDQRTELKKQTRELP